MHGASQGAASDAERSRHHLSVHARRMNRVLDYVDQHLDGPLELSALAELVHFSPYHFHRLFTAWIGATLCEYGARRRLEVAAQQLAFDRRKPVLEIALAVGFGSGEAFARAFKTHFGHSPSAWRADTPRRWTEQLAAAGRSGRHSNPDQARRPTFGHHDGSPMTFQEISMEVQIRELPATRIAYLRHIGPYGASVGEFWGNTFWPWLKANGLTQRPLYGISHDDPGVTPAQHCRYDTAVEVTDDFVASGQASLATLPGGRYAVAQFKGTAATIGDAWTELFKSWLPASGLQCDARPCFEYYRPDASFDPNTGVFECELCIPVSA